MQGFQNLSFMSIYYTGRWYCRDVLFEFHQLVLVFQLEVDRLLTGLTAQKKGTNAG